MLFFGKDFTSPLYTPDLPFTGAIRLRDIQHRYQDHDIIAEHACEPKGVIQSCENAGDRPLPGSNYSN